MSNTSDNPSRYLVRYPFPLNDGLFASLDLPSDGLHSEEAQRLAAFIETLVVGDTTEENDDAV